MSNYLKKIKLLLAIVSSFLLLINVKAKTTTIEESSELKGINITKNVSNVISNVNATFNYKVSEVRSDNPDGIGGINEDFSITFDNVTPVNNIATVTKTLDLSYLSFNKVGDYYLKICEVSSSDLSKYPIDNKCYYPLVMVRNELANNIPTGNLVATLLSTVSDGENKTDAIFTTRPMSYITISNGVTGDMADKDEYFKFKITIDSDNLENININNQDSKVLYNGEEVITSSTYNSNQDNFVYLKHGQSITIGDGENAQIPSGISFTIEELDKDNYKTYIDEVNEDNKKLIVEKLSHISDENINNFVNNYERVTFTGIVVNIIPYLIILLIGTILLIIIRKKYEKE